MIIERTIKSNNTLIELFQFKGRTETIEYHAYLHATNSLLSFQEQLLSLAKAAKDLLSLVPQGTQCFMAKCHVSDAANQSDTIKNILSPLLKQYIIHNSATSSRWYQDCTMDLCSKQCRKKIHKWCK